MRRFFTAAAACLYFTLHAGAAEWDLETLREACKLQVLERTAPCALQVVKFEVLGATAESISEDSAIDFIERAAIAWDEQQRVDSVVALSSALAVPAERLPGMWTSGELRQDGFKSRKTFEPGVVAGAGSFKSDAVVDGLIQVYYNDYRVGAGQVSFYERTGWSWDRPSDLFPNVTDLRAVVDRDDDRGVAVCDSPFGRVRFNTASGTIQSVDRRLSATSRVFRRFSGYADDHSPVAGAILVPRFTASISIRDGFVHILTLYLIEGVRLPESLDDSEFAVPVPRGTTAVLFPPGKMQDSVVTTRLGVDLQDAREFLPTLRDMATRRRLKKEPAVAEQPLQPAGGGSHYWWLLGANGVALLALAAFLVLRSRRRSE